MKQNNTPVSNKDEARGKSKIIAGAAGLTAIIAVIGLSLVTFAQDNGSGHLFWGKDKNLKGNPEQHQAMMEAFTNNDYEAWLKLTEGNQAADKISQEDFEKLAQVKVLWAEGKYEEAEELKKELGLDYGHMQGMGKGMYFKKDISPGKLEELKAMKEAMQNAIENNDYSAWLEAVGVDSPKAKIVTKDNFSKLIEAHNLVQEGKYEEAREIKEELGIGFGCGMMGGTRGYHKLNN
ncbi:MAG: hypothetical protein ABIE43_05210 [Patescibacteria group bacterium]